MTQRRRAFAFAILVAACLIGAVVAILSAVNGSAPPAPASSGAGAALASAQERHVPVTVVRTVDPGNTSDDGQLAVYDASAATGKQRTLESMRCERVYYAAGNGICIARGTGFASGYAVQLFDSRFRVRKSIPVQGIPSRARVSPDGRYGAVTMFVTGHAYATPGTFSTQTTLIDMRAGTKIADLEQFAVTDGSKRITAVDVNFWGVTFARDPDTFYATLATGGKTYLLRGSVRARQATVLHENVECPSLSPDGKRIVFKYRTRSAERPWRLTVLDLSTMHETPLAEPRSVDDQAEWLDDGHILYGLDGAVWEVPADGTGHPQRYLSAAGSPAVVPG